MFGNVTFTNSFFYKSSICTQNLNFLLGGNYFKRKETDNQKKKKDHSNLVLNISRQPMEITAYSQSSHRKCRKDTLKYLYSQSGMGVSLIIGIFSRSVRNIYHKYYL